LASKTVTIDQITDSNLLGEYTIQLKGTITVTNPHSSNVDSFVQSFTLKVKDCSQTTQAIILVDSDTNDPENPFEYFLGTGEEVITFP
jgi:hypothetical protein